MPKRAIIDLLVIGADAAGFAAAACAAKGGASVALVAMGSEPPPAGSVVEPPNFIWRLLDLHLYGLKSEVDAPTTTLAADDRLSLGTDPLKTGAALGEREATLEFLWPQFAARPTHAGAASSAAEQFLSADALLDDYFSDELLKTHLLSLYVAPFGHAGGEAGTASALGFIAHAGQPRLAAAALSEALEAAAGKAGVEALGGRLQSLMRPDGKSWRAASDNGHEIRARKAMVSGALIGEAAGIRIDCEEHSLLRRAGAEATIRIRCEKRPELRGDKKRGAFFTASDRSDIRRAYDAMIDGAIEEEPVLSFEIEGKEILARMPFCPARLRDGENEREWTGQDRQILGRRAAALIAKRLGCDLGAIREVEIFIGPDVASGLRRRAFNIDAVPAPSPSPDAIGAAARLAMEIVRHD